MLELKEIDKYYNPGTLNERRAFLSILICRLRMENLFRLSEVTVPVKHLC